MRPGFFVGVRVVGAGVGVSILSHHCFNDCDQCQDLLMGWVGIVEVTRGLEIIILGITLGDQGFIYVVRSIIKVIFKVSTVSLELVTV